MSKEIKETHEYTPANNQPMRSIVVVETDDDVRYVFEHGVVRDKKSHEREVKIRFSHRCYPHRPPEEYHQTGNHRLPASVEKYIEDEYGEIEFIDGTIPEVSDRQTAVARLSK